MTPANATPLVWLLVAFLVLAVTVVALYWNPFRNQGEDTAETGGPPPRPQPQQGAGTSRCTDEERILELLDVNGGRLRQREIAGRTGWSEAKVSRVLSRMDRHDQVSKIPIGRENIIALPDHEPEIVRT
jgi:uncharacterized membrane protein